MLKGQKHCKLLQGGGGGWGGGPQGRYSLSRCRASGMYRPSPRAACGDEARRNEADGTFHRICNGSCLALKRAIVAPRCGTGHTWDAFITACKPSSLARVRFFLRAASGMGSD